MAGLTIISPFAQRSRLSAILVVVWMSCFLSIVFTLWYINTLHPETAQMYKAKLKGLLGGNLNNA